MASNDNLPLDKRVAMVTSKNGNFEEVSLLDRRFMMEINFMSYRTYPIDDAKGSLAKDWLQEVKIISNDLETLLKLPHDRFWAQLIHDHSLHKLLSEFLQKAPRCWDSWEIPPDMKLVHDKLLRLVFITILRMSTDHESKVNFLTPEAFGFAIYENFMFDIPKMMDICSLYGHPFGGNGIMVNKMLTNVFTKQPAFVNDLKVVAASTKEIFDTIPQRYDSCQSSGSLYDLFYYSYDTFTSLFTFFSTYPPTLSFFNATDMISTLSHMYGHIFSGSNVKLKKVSSNNEVEMKTFSTLIGKCKLSLLKLVNCIIWQFCSMDKLSDSTISREEHTSIAEHFIAMISMFLGEKAFMTKFYSKCNLLETFDLIRCSKAEVGDDHFDYILNAIDLSAPQQTIPGSSAASSHPDLEEFTISVQSIFPQLSPNFIEKCLEYHNYSVEQVIAALLEDNLPPHLIDLRDGSGSPGPSTSNAAGPSSSTAAAFNTILMPKAEPQPSSSKDVPQASDSMEGASSAVPDGPFSLIKSRRNVFDGDEFDVFNNPHELNFDMIHKGKATKTITKDESSTRGFLLNNPKFNNEYDEYEDEYDDTYEDMAAAGDGGDGAGEFIIKPLNAPLPVESSSDEGEDGDIAPNNNGQWTNDRARGRGRGGNRGRGDNERGAKTTHVDQKGVKADKQTLVNRANANKNKSARGNHNRRAGADKKRRGGMLHM